MKALQKKKNVKAANRFPHLCCYPITLPGFVSLQKKERKKYIHILTFFLKFCLWVFSFLISATVAHPFKMFDKNELKLFKKKFSLAKTLHFLGFMIFFTLEICCLTHIYCAILNSHNEFIWKFFSPTIHSTVIYNCNSISNSGF